MKAILKHYDWYVGTDIEHEHAEILFEDEHKAIKQAARIIGRICDAHNTPRIDIKSDTVFFDSCVPQFGETTEVEHSEMRLSVEVPVVSGLMEKHLITVIFESAE